MTHDMSDHLVLRPCRLADLGAVERIAAASGMGVSTLPTDPQKLYEKIGASAHAFSSASDASGEEVYLFVLEDVGRGEIVGTSGIAASAGYGDRFDSYRNEFIMHASQELGASNRIHTLHLCHDLTGASLLTSFYIDPAYEATAWPHLLSRARLLFMAEHPTLFSDRVAAEFPGLCDTEGRSPFWDAVGRSFFNLDYPQAEQLAGGRSKRFIAELMPQYPLYVPLLPPEAQLAIGQLHPTCELPFKVLLDEGFEPDTYIDIFDGGPTVEARLQSLTSVRFSRHARVLRSAETTLHAVPHLIANGSTQGFRATIANLPLASGDEVSISPDVADLLEVVSGDDVRVVRLRQEVC